MRTRRGPSTRATRSMAARAASEAPLSRTMISSANSRMDSTAGSSHSSSPRTRTTALMPSGRASGRATTPTTGASERASRAALRASTLENPADADGAEEGSHGGAEIEALVDEGHRALPELAAAGALVEQLRRRRREQLRRRTREQHARLAVAHRRPD